MIAGGAGLVIGLIQESVRWRSRRSVTYEEREPPPPPRY